MSNVFLGKWSKHMYNSSWWITNMSLPKTEDKPKCPQEWETWLPCVFSTTILCGITYYFSTPFLVFSYDTKKIGLQKNNVKENKRLDFSVYLPMYTFIHIHIYIDIYIYIYVDICRDVYDAYRYIIIFTIYTIYIYI